MTLTLAEWRPSPPLRLTSSVRAGLERHFKVTITSGPTADTFVVIPGNVIGTLRIDATDVVVAPKLEIDRVLFMVAYANDPVTWRDHWARLTGVKDLVDGIASLFVATSDLALARGLYRSYRRVDEDEVTIRGRIRWQRQARRVSPLPIAVRYNVHDDDVPENQVLRAALSILRWTRLTDPRVAAGVARLWRQFKDFTVLNAPLEALTRIQWNRQNEHYRPLLSLARVVLEDAMTELGDGEVATRGFTLSMPTVFEQFVRTALREQSGFTLKEFPDRAAEHHLRLDTDNRVRLLPDLGIRIEGRWVFVGDVKYKRDDGKGRDADLYQLLAYATATGLDEATLIYADGPVDAPHHLVRHTGIQLNLLHLDLSRPPHEVLTQLAEVNPRAAIDREISHRAHLTLPGRSRR